MYAPRTRISAFWTTTPFTVTVTLSSSCSVSAASLSFGNVGVLNANVDAATNVSVTCTYTTPYQVQLSAGAASGAIDDLAGHDQRGRKGFLRALPKRWPIDELGLEPRRRHGLRHGHGLGPEHPRIWAHPAADDADDRHVFRYGRGDGQLLIRAPADVGRRVRRPDIERLARGTTGLSATRTRVDFTKLARARAGWDVFAEGDKCITRYSS